MKTNVGHEAHHRSSDSLMMSQNMMTLAEIKTEPSWMEEPLQSQDLNQIGRGVFYPPSKKRTLTQPISDNSMETHMTLDWFTDEFNTPGLENESKMIEEIKEDWAEDEENMYTGEFYLNNNLVKNNSFEDLKVISTNPQSVVPISYAEQIYGRVMVSEVDTLSSESDLMLGREEEVLYTEQEPKLQKPLKEINMGNSSNLKTMTNKSSKVSFWQLADKPEIVVKPPQIIDIDLSPSPLAVLATTEPQTPLEEMTDFDIVKYIMGEGREPKTVEPTPIPSESNSTTNSQLSTIDISQLQFSTIADRIKVGNKRPRKTKTYTEHVMVESEEEEEDVYEPSTSRRKRLDSEDERYRELRDKNNEASRRSRQTRKEKEREMFEEERMLKNRNIELSVTAKELERQILHYRKCLLETVKRT